MTNHTIDDLLSMLERNGWQRYHAELIALVAERNTLREENDSLRSRCKAHQDDVLDRVFALDALRKRVAELEAKPPADRDLRKDLICAALTGLCANPMHHTQTTNVLSDAAIMVADGTIAAIRKEDK
jgi:hypothetical protein